MLEIANSLEAVNEPLDAVTPEELGSMLFVEYTMFYMGVHPGDFVSEFLEDYGLIEDEMKEQVEAAIWDVFE